MKFAQGAFTIARDVVASGMSQTVRQGLMHAPRAPFSESSESNIQSWKDLQRPNDLPSKGEFIRLLMTAIDENREIKRHQTTDPQTRAIWKKIMEPNGVKCGPSENQPPLENQHPPADVDTEIVITDISKYPEYLKQYEASLQQARENGEPENVMVAVGGPSARDQMVLAHLIGELDQSIEKLMHLLDHEALANIVHSAWQAHTRHANALNADPALTGHALFLMFLLRALLPALPEEALKNPAYVKIDLNLRTVLANLPIYLGNELNWAKQELRSAMGQETQHALNRQVGILSSEIMAWLEKKIGEPLSARNHHQSNAIHISFTEEQVDEMRHENADLARQGISSRELSREEIQKILPEGQEIQGAFLYPFDTSINPNIASVYKDKFPEVIWKEGWEVRRVFLKNVDGKAQMVGLGVVDANLPRRTGNDKGEEEMTFIRCNKAHLSCGYRARYRYDTSGNNEGDFCRRGLNRLENTLGLRTPLGDGTVPAAGFSADAIFKRSPAIEHLIKTGGMQFAVVNSHWTILGQDKDHVVIRITGGGNTGSKEYKPMHALNVMGNTVRLFGSDFIGVHDSYGCPRSINKWNSSRFITLCEGLLASFGKGGTGNTKRFAEAAFALITLGYGDALQKYFNTFKSEDGRKFGDEIIAMFNRFQQEFADDASDKTSQRMGFSNGVSLGEGGTLAALLTSLAVIAGFMVEQEAEEDDAKLSTAEVTQEQSLETAQSAMQAVHEAESKRSAMLM